MKKILKVCLAFTETTCGTTYSYTYDTYGNILSRTGGGTTDTFTYGDTDWLDLLTAYNGNPIAYDAIGNPTEWYDGTEFTWVNGRRLASAENGTNAYSYTYNADGLRLSKTINGVEHKYLWQGDTLLSENYGGITLEFFYDESGIPSSFIYTASDSATPVTYYYVTNLQGDVVKIIDASGNSVAQYTYNAWGKVLTATGSMANINPIRYRGYYYDSETEWYYVSIRYYDPEICRFISPDDPNILTANPGALTDKNLFAYCDNNPVMREDNGGQFWNFIIGAVGGALVGGGVQVLYNLMSGNNWSDGLVVAMATGAASGLLAASGIGLFGSMAGNAAISMAGNTANQVTNNNGFNNFDIEDMLIDGVIGGIAGAVGGRGMGKYANIKNLNNSLTKKILSGSSNMAKNGIMYYVSQTKYAYIEYLLKPLRNSGVAALVAYIGYEYVNR